MDFLGHRIRTVGATTPRNKTVKITLKRRFECYGYLLPQEFFGVVVEIEFSRSKEQTLDANNYEIVV